MNSLISRPAARRTTGEPRRMLLMRNQDEEIAAVAREIIGDEPQRDIAKRAGVHQATLHNLLRGDLIKYQTAVTIAEGLALEPGLRRRFFAALRFPDPHLSELEGVLEGATVEALRGIRDAPEEDLAELNRLVRRQIERARRRRGENGEA